MLDYQELLLAPIYDQFGVPATLETSGGDSFEVTILDKTAGISVPTLSVIEMQTARPMARIRKQELADLGITDVNDIYEGQLTFNDKPWRIKSHEPRQTPDANGQFILYLADETEFE